MKFYFIFLLFLQLDLPFSTTFYRWLLNEENSLSISDLAEIAPEVQATLLRLQDIVIKRDAIQSDTTFDVIEKTEKVSFFSSNF